MIAPGAVPSALAGLILILVPKLRGITSGRSVDGITSEYITHAGVVADWLSIDQMVNLRIHGIVD